jgi:hypothetical protein
MSNRKTSKLSAKELAALQAKVDAGTALTDTEQAAYDAATAPVEDPASTPDLSSQLERIADLMLAKSHGHVSGGKPHVPLTAEELAKRPKMSMEEKAEEYYGGVKLAEFPWPGIHVTSDNQVFLGNVLGENARDNHIASSMVNGSPTLTFKSYPKP